MSKDLNFLPTIDERPYLIDKTADPTVVKLGLPDGSKVYVANADSGSVSVITIARNNVPSSIASIPLDTSSHTGSRPFGLALTPDGRKLFVAVYSWDEVLVISTESGLVTDTVAAGTTPYNVAINPAGTRAYVTNYTTASVAVIDTVSPPSVVSSIAVGANAWGVAVTPDGSRVLVTGSASNRVSIIDAGSPTVVQNVSVSDTPTGVAITPDGTRAWVTRNGSTSVAILDLGWVGSSGGDGTQIPRAAMQQFQVPPGTASTECAAFAPDHVDWPALTGMHDFGWGVSYAQWPNGQQGGWVCTRQPYWVGPGWSVR